MVIDLTLCECLVSEGSGSIGFCLLGQHSLRALGMHLARLIGRRGPVNERQRGWRPWSRLARVACPYKLDSGPEVN